MISLDVVLKAKITILVEAFFNLDLQSGIESNLSKSVQVVKSQLIINRILVEIIDH